jgi:hypothetical protein
MSRPRAAYDFATIRARMEELRREREQAEAEKPSEHIPVRATRIGRLAIAVIGRGARAG